ncbi:MAG TPA: hypothetical protein VNM47_03320, partial [Terriglobia bacterium]|nr:hypothetical protein [Terriglobia bacterium]
MFSRHKQMMGVLYLLADATLALASFALAYWVRARFITPQPLYRDPNYFWIIPYAIVLWIVVGLVSGSYREIQEENLLRTFWDPFKAAFLGTALLFATIFAFKLVYISRLLLALYAIILLLAMIGFRLAARRLGDPLRRNFGGYREFLLVGDAPAMVEVARAIEANEKRGMRIFGFARIGATAENPQPAAGLRREYPVYSLDQLPELVRRHVIDEVVFAAAKG